MSKVKKETVPEVLAMQMLRVQFRMVGANPLSWSAPVMDSRSKNETDESFEDRTWMKKIHVRDDGHVFIPGLAIKQAITDQAKYRSDRIKGRNMTTYTKHFTSGFVVEGEVVLDQTVDDIQKQTLFVPSNGKKGGGSKVWKHFPLLMPWAGRVSLLVMDPILVGAPSQIQEYIIGAGMFQGVGRWRPANGGYYGRFKVEDLTMNKGDMETFSA